MARSHGEEENRRERKKEEEKGQHGLRRGPSPQKR